MASITIPLSNSTLSSIEYYITATDDCGVRGYWSGRTAENPYAVDVVAGQALPEVPAGDAADTNQGIHFSSTLTGASASEMAVDPEVIAPLTAHAVPPETSEVSLFVTDEAGLIDSSAAKSLPGIESLRQYIRSPRNP